MRDACDQSIRDSVGSDLGTTYFLEASAGTGKTSVLVDRYVTCVLAAGDVRAVAAITFTEKAAAELRQRIREALEALEEEAETGGERTGVIRRALDLLDDAPISTIHGFAGRLLREFPVEAGIDPAFEQLDELGSELARARMWQDWLAELADGEVVADGPRAWLARLLRAGVKLDDLRELSIGPRGAFAERYDVRADPPRPEPDLAAGLERLDAAVRELEEYCGRACSDPVDGGCRSALSLVDQCERLQDEGPATDVDACAALLLGVKFTEKQGGLRGSMGNWDATLGGKDGLWERYQAATRCVADLRNDYAEFLAGLALAFAGAFARWADDVQLSLGQLDFADLLGRLRDLLRGASGPGGAARDLEPRRLLQQRFRYVLVDEFQDTDPLQAEIMFFLCEEEPLAHDWQDAALRPGKLFVVGDPKQSIYRFRRADITMYEGVKQLIAAQPGGKALRLRQNFRTTPEVVAWVNHVFFTLFRHVDAGRQPRYSVVKPRRLAADGSSVSVLLGREYAARGETEEARRDEAEAVAGLLANLPGDEERWPIHRGRPGAPEERRAPRWRDVTILYRTTSALETLEDALRRAGVPYRVEGGKAYFQRREVDDVLLCLRAVSDPSDGPAVYGALHSTLFGFSDDDLFLFWAAGGRFDLFAAQPPAHGAVADALRTLRELHTMRLRLEPHEMVAELIARTQTPELVAAGGRGAAQATANLEKLTERARAFAGAGGGGLGEFLRWAAEAGDTAGEQESPVDDEGDMVTLMTIHKAKGLEAPIVILMGGALSGRSGPTGEPLVDRPNKRLRVRLRAALPGSAAQVVEPVSYRDVAAAEKLMSDSELRRLLYVAVTRARDHLVITRFGTPTTQAGAPASGALLGPIAWALPAPGEDEAEAGASCLRILSRQESPPESPVAEGLNVPALLAERTAWLERRRQVVAEASRPAPATSPSGLEHVDEEVRTGGPGAPAGRAQALALGSAVHRIMELCDLADPASVARLAGPVAAELGRPDLEDEAAELAMACWAAPPVRAAAEALAADPDAVLREVPVGALVDDVVVSGAIDLLYRAADGWVVVDYKTDRAADPDTLLARYRPQGAAYAVAVEAVLGERTVRDVVFVPARAGGVPVVVPVDEDLRALARREVGAAAGEGRAVCRDEAHA